ncbi:MAG: DUF4364 family protein [Firmicutes bacterium]|nr:DUF4364 family protein [Bacillota bacterium]
MRKKQLAENKLLILFLLYQMDIPMTVTQITEFAVDREYMDYFSFQEHMHELQEEALVDEKYENETTRYFITADGEQVLNYFSKQIPNEKRVAVLDYTTKNKGSIKKDINVLANYFYNKENDYTVKCGIYEDAKTLLEINVTVPSKEDAKLLKKNWKENIPYLYGNILHTLLQQPEGIEEKSLEIAEALAKNKKRKKNPAE